MNATCFPENHPSNAFHWSNSASPESFGVGLRQPCRAEVRRRLGAFGLQLTPNKAAEFVFRLFQPHFFVSIFSIFPQFLASVAFSGEITEGSWAIAQS